MRRTMPLTGPEKAVLLLLSLDEAVAAPIVAELDDAHLRKLREVASLMRAVPARSLDEVYEEFVGRAQEAIAIPRGGIRYFRKLAQKALGEARAHDVFVDAPVSAFERLSTAAPSTVAALLENEHPQLVAALLSQLDPARAARVLESIPEERQTDVLARLGTMTEVPAGLLEGVAAAVAADLPPADAEAAVSVDGVARAAAVVRKLGKATGQALLERLGDQHNEVATEVRRAMYTFEDLRGLDPRSMRALLKEVQAERLVLALKTASDEVKAQIFSSMSSRAAELLRDDLSQLRNVRLADVEAAQTEIVEAALRLEAEGTISLGNDDEQLV